MSRIKEAPGWARWAIETARPEIIAAHGRDKLPTSWDVLGCGVFGCTMNVGDPRWVCKVTVDGTEAFLADVLRERFDGHLPGLCEYLEPIRLDSDAGPVWILWRSRVEMPTLEAELHRIGSALPNYSDLAWDCYDATKDQPKEVRSAAFRTCHEQADAQRTTDYLRTGYDAKETVHELTNCGLSVAGWMRTLTVDGMPERTFVNDLQQAARRAVSSFSPKHKTSWGWTYGDAELTGIESAAVRLLGYGFQLDRLRGNVLVPELAASLARLFDAGVLLCDLNSDNFARLDGVWTLFDGGFCVPTHERWLPTWERVRPNLWHWWSNKGWEPLEGLKPSEPNALPNPVHRRRA